MQAACQLFLEISHWSRQWHAERDLPCRVIALTTHRCRVFRCQYHSVAFSFDGKMLAAISGAPDHVLVLWAWDKGRQVTVYKMGQQATKVRNAVPSAAEVGLSAAAARRPRFRPLSVVLEKDAQSKCWALRAKDVSNENGGSSGVEILSSGRVQVQAQAQAHAPPKGLARSTGMGTGMGTCTGADKGMSMSACMHTCTC
eukprot:1715561-Pleurochrysis_carterae.AAC.2